MYGDDILIRSLLLPPRLPRRWLARDRLDNLLSSVVEYPLTVVSASAGYGKSTALAAFAAQDRYPTIWYTVGEMACDDPVVFLVHLVHACRSLAASAEAGSNALAILQHGGSGQQVWGHALDSLVNDLVPALDRETILVLDDYHKVGEHPDIRALIERLIETLPPLLHIVLSTRRRPQLDCLPTLRIRGELLEIGEEQLAFTVDETSRLFTSVYGQGLAEEEAPQVSEQTGGWAIALQLVWQSKQASVDTQQADSEGSVLGARSRDALFAYLAREVLARQPAKIRTFLLRSSVLSELEPAACDRVLGTNDSASQLEALYRQGLFLTASGSGAYRYHPLFHAFLQEHAAATLPEWDALHTQAAEYYREIRSGEQVMYHLLATGDVKGAALELEHWTPSWLGSGRLMTVLSWIDQIPADEIKAHPQLLIARGDAARLLARFDSARRAYEQAARIYQAQGDPTGQALALKGQAMVYIDTVQPAPAESLLRQAFRMLPQAEQAARTELLVLIAENRLNRGRADQALRLLDFGQRDTSQASRIEARALVRLGRLAEARSKLQAEMDREHESLPGNRPFEAHREVTLLLSLVGIMEGDPASALSYAQAGLDASRRLGSILFEAEARICAGHATQPAHPDEYRAINEHYLQAMVLADSLHVQHPKAEAYLGLALLHGFRGDLAAAQDAAREGLSIVERSGDEWTAAQLWTALGAVATANGAPDAEGYLDEALKRYRAGRDTYGQAVVHLWRSIRYYRKGDPKQAALFAIQAFELAQRHGYRGLLSNRTLFGPRDQMMLVPVLLAAREHPRWRVEAQALLNRAFPAVAADDATQTYNPGVTLKIQTLGPLRVWRGSEELGPHEWQRKKAQQMLALLVTNRERWLLREQICDMLWPEEGQSETEAQFKVTLNGLNAALEPLRPPRTPPFYVRRQGGAYRFCPPGGVWLDVEEFEARLDSARALRVRNTEYGIRDEANSDGADRAWAYYEELERAVELHQGAYLSDWLYEDWARDERERLEARYMEAATLLAEALLGRNELTEAIRLCESVLVRDPGWEDAYCVLMRAYARQGQRRMALATYERCVRNLREYLDIEPLPSTTRIYEDVKNDEWRVTGGE